VQRQYRFNGGDQSRDVCAGVSNELGVRNPAWSAGILFVSVVHIDFIPRAIVEPV
jgi:hypothetical protein